MMSNNNCKKWLIWCVAAFVMMIDFGLPPSFGALFISMMGTFHTDRAATVTIQALLFGVSLGFGVVSGGLISRFGLPKVILASSILVPLGFITSFFASNINILYFSIGIVSATGISMTYIGTVVLTGRLFTGRQQILCVTLLLTLGGVAHILYPYLMIYLVEEYGLYGTFLILGGITCNTFVLFTICWANKITIEHNNSISGKSAGKVYIRKEDDINNRRQSIIAQALYFLNKLMTKSYICLLVATGLSASVLGVYVGFILDIEAWKSFGYHGALTFMVFNVCNIASRLMSGLLKQKKGVNIFIYPIISTICGCVGQLAVLFSKEYSVYLIGTSLTGIAFGGVVASSVSAVVEIVFPEQVPVGSGLLVTVAGILTVCAGPVFGSIRDQSGSYGNVIIIVSCVQSAAGVFYTLAMLSHRNNKKSVVLV